MERAAPPIRTRWAGKTLAMHERFTDRARKVMQLANQEAQRFNHEYIGTEHILIALPTDDANIALNTLEQFSLTQ